MEKKDEFVEMRVRTIDEAMNVDKLIGHLTFDQVMDDEEKMDIMMLDGQNFKLLLEEVNEPHRMMLGIINPDEADLLYAAVNDPEGTDATLPYQTVHILKELGVTVEKVVVKDKVKLLHRAIVTLRKEDGSVMEMEDAIRREDYEYAELIKQEMATRNKEEEEDYEDLEDLEKEL